LVFKTLCFVGDFEKSISALCFSFDVLLQCGVQYRSTSVADRSFEALELICELRELRGVVPSVSSTILRRKEAGTQATLMQLNVTGGRITTAPFSSNMVASAAFWFRYAHMSGETPACTQLNA
jgi:hypothetical protein